MIKSGAEYLQSDAAKNPVETQQSLSDILISSDQVAADLIDIDKIADFLDKTEFLRKLRPNKN